MAEFFIGAEISYLNRLSQFDVSLWAADLYNGSTTGNSEVLWALFTRLNTDRDEKIKIRWSMHFWGYMGIGLQFLSWDLHG